MSKEHQASAAAFKYKDREYRYEALGVIQRLLRDAHPEKGDDEIQDEVDNCVVLDTKTNTAEAEDEERKVTEKLIYGRAETMAFDGRSDGMPEFLHHIGSAGGPTTRVSTANRYGAKYHMFHEMQTEDDLRLDLHTFLRRERMLRAAPGGVRVAAAALTTDEREDRNYMFGVWNAAVAEDCVLGIGGASEESIAKYQFAKHGALPSLLTQQHEPQPKDIPLHAEAEALLGKFLLFCGRGERLHSDRRLVREQLKSTALDNESEQVRKIYLLKKVWAFGPWLLLQGGKEIVDAPGSGDLTPLHRRQLRNAIEAADHVILVGEANIAAPVGALQALQDSGALERFRRGTLQLSMVHNHEKRKLGLANFKQRDLTAEAKAAKNSKGALFSLLMELEGDGDVDDPTDVVTDRINSRVRVLTIYSLLYAGLKLCPARAESVLEPAELQQVLADTQGEKLLALLEGLNLDHVCETLETLSKGPLASARDALRTRLARLDVPTASATLHGRVADLTAPEPSRATKTRKDNIRDAISNSYSGTAISPHNKLRDRLQSALSDFHAAVRSDFEGEATRRLADARWRRARVKLVADAAGAQQAHRALQNDEPGPAGMDLQNALYGNMLLPADAVETLVTAVDDAFNEFVSDCTALLTDQLFVVAGFDVAEQNVAQRTLREFASVEGRALLMSRASSARAGRLGSRSQLTRQLTAAKVSALQREVGAKTPVPSDNDTAGVATLVETHRARLYTTTLTEFEARTAQIVTGMMLDISRALRPVTVRPRHARKTPAMDSYIDSALDYMCVMLDPKPSADARKTLTALCARGDEASALLDEVVAALRQAQENASTLGAAMGHSLEILALFRPLYRELGDGPSVRSMPLHTRNNMPLPNGVKLVNATAPGGQGAAFNSRLAMRGNEQYVTALEGVLATQRIPLAIPEDGAANVGALDDSLWSVLASQLFHSRDGGGPRAVAARLRTVTLAYMTAHYGNARRAAKFLQEHGVALATYVEQLRTGDRRAGLLELMHACWVRRVQVCVWVADESATRLLVYHNPGAAHQPGPRAFNIALVNGGDEFKPVVRKRLADGGGGVQWSASEGAVTGLHEYHLLPGEQRGMRPVSSAALPKRSALKRTASGGRGAGAGGGAAGGEQGGGSPRSGKHARLR